uniref:THAP domain-containing protein 1 n=1 Tax=Leptobrachium leishanense TaxID=445787 RepID=A0A8C5M4F8_9ANUR
MRCIVVGCTNYHGSKFFREKGVSMHNFPKDRRRAKTWLEASTDHFDDIEETLNFITKTLEGRRIKICSEHFTQDCFNIAENRQLLTKNAIPSIFKKNKRSISVFNLPLPGNPVAGTSASGASSILFSEQEDRPTHSDDAASVTIKEHDYTLIIVMLQLSHLKVTTGCLLKVYTICEQNHKCLVWRSQPLIGKRSIGNILASAGILFSGSHYAKMNEYFKLIGVPF